MILQFLSIRTLLRSLLTVGFLWFSLSGAFAQLPLPNMYYDISQYEELSISNCDYPFYTFSSSTVGPTDTFEWKVVKGEVDWVFENTPTVQINDIKPDTLILAYNVWSQANNLVSSDTIMYLPFFGFCEFIERGNLPTAAECGDTITFGSILGSPVYDVNWFSSQDGNEIEILNHWGEQTEVVINSAGTIFLDAFTSTTRFQNVVTDQVSFQATCPTSTVTQADAGDPIYTEVCNFPYTLHSVNQPALGETSSWRVIEGEAYYFDDQEGNIIINDASGFTRLEYSITDGITTTKDTLEVNVNLFNSGPCDLFAINTSVSCSDTVIIYSYINSFGYQYQWNFPVDTEVIEEGKDYARVIFKNDGFNQVSLDVVTPDGITSYTKYLDFDVTCSTGTVTQADAGTDFDIPACGFPFTHQVGAPLPGETAIWNDLTGGVYFTYDQNGHLEIQYASNVIEMEYVLTDGITNTRDTVQFRIDEFDPSCGIFPENQRYNCQDTVVIHRPHTQFNFDYTHHWVIPSEAIVIDSTSERIRLVFTDQGVKTVEYHESHVFGFNDVVYTTAVEIRCNASTYVIEGTATINQNYLLYGVAYLMSADETNVIPVDSTPVNYGDYRFEDVTLGEYTVYVVPYTDAARTEIMNDFVPTYYVNKTRREDANEIDVYDNTYSVDVALIENTVISTTHEVEVELPVVFYDGYIPVIMMNENGEIICAAVPEEGTVMFNNLTNGRYYLEIPTNNGYVQSEWFEVNYPNESIVARISEEQITTSLNRVLTRNVRTFPNPFQENLVVGSADGGEMAVTVFNITGEVVYQGSLFGELKLDTEAWTMGTYMVRVVQDDQVYTMTVIKQ